MIIASNDQLSLRELTLDDAEFILELVNEPAWLEHIGDKGVRNLSDARDYLRQGPMASYREHGFGLWAVLPAKTDTAAGICGLLKREWLSHVDLGYGLLAAWRGRGLARSAARLSMQLAREHFELDTLLAITSANNHASIALLEALDFDYQHEARPPGAEPVALYRWHSEPP